MSDIAPPPAASPADSQAEIRRAAIAGLSGYLMWGLAPLFFRLLDFASPLEIVLHRVVWAVPLLFALLWVSRKLPAARAVLADRRTLVTLLLSAALISINWWTFVWSVHNGALLQASLGYYVNPLMSVAVGVVLLKEPLGPRRIIAIALAAAGVANMVITVGELPWVTIVLALSFTAYGYIRKTAAVDGRVGLFWETAFIFPIALIGMIWLGVSGAGHFTDSPVRAVLLILAGVITVTPLMLYIIGTRGLRLSTMGVLQFIAPSLQFAIGVAFGEAFTVQHAVTFGLIWTGVAVFVWSQLSRVPERA